MARARTAKQKAALRKAQLASARKRRRGGSSKAPSRKRSSRKKRLLKGVGYVVAARYFVGKGAKYQTITQREKRNAAERDWKHQRDQRAKYRKNLARHRADTRGLPSGSQKAKGTAWYYDWAGTR